MSSYAVVRVVGDKASVLSASFASVEAAKSWINRVNQYTPRPKGKVRVMSHDEVATQYRALPYPK